MLHLRDAHFTISTIVPGPRAHQAFQAMTFPSERTHFSVTGPSGVSISKR